MDNEKIVETCKRIVRNEIVKAVGPYKDKVEKFSYKGMNTGYLIGIVTRRISPAITIERQSVNGRYKKVSQEKVEQFTSYAEAELTMEAAVNKQMGDLDAYHNEIHSTSTNEPVKAFQFVNGRKMSLQPSHACIGVEDCKTCLGNGNVNCSSCAGTGKVSCRTCSGSGLVDESYTEQVSVHCSSCYGRGSHTSQEQVIGGRPGDYRNVTRTCNYCYGSGTTMDTVVRWRRVHCQTCRATGQVACSTCRATGRVTCHICEGHGEQSKLYVMAAVYRQSSSISLTDDKATSTPLCHQVLASIKSDDINPDDVCFSYVGSDEQTCESTVKRVSHYAITELEIDKLEDGTSRISLLGGTNDQPTVTHSDEAILDKTLSFLVDSNNEESLDALVSDMDGIANLPAINLQSEINLLSSSFINKAKSIKKRLEEVVLSAGRSQQVKKWLFSFIFILFSFALLVSEFPFEISLELSHQNHLGLALFSALIAAWISVTCINKGQVLAGTRPAMKGRKIIAAIAAIITAVSTFIVLGPEQIDKNISITEHVRTISSYILITGFSGLFSYLIQGKIASKKCMIVLNKYRDILGN